MAGKGPRHDSRDGHHSKDNHHSRDGPRRVCSPGPPSGRSSSSKLDHDGPPPLIGPPLGGHTPPMMIEHKLAMQHAEIQRLLGENQRLAVTHIALRQELSAAHQEIMRMHQSRPFGDTEKEQRFTITQVALRQELADAKQEINRLQDALADKDQHIRATVERGAQMEAEWKTTESLKANLDKLRFERDELLTRVEHLTAEVKKLPVKDQEIASLKTEVDELRQRHQQARMDFEHQKKVNLENLEQKQALERNNFTMSREIERLRTELMTLERKVHGSYSASSGVAAPPSLHGSVLGAGSYETNYSANQEILKSGKQGLDPAETKPGSEALKYRTGIEAYQSGIQGSQDHIIANTDSSGEWVKHSAANGKAFYYNPTSGATSWNKSSSVADPHSMAQRPIAQSQAQISQTPDPSLLPTTHQQPSSVVKQETAASVVQPQPPSSHQAFSIATMHQTAQHQSQQMNYGINLLVFGLSEGINDRDLASLFHPYGTILYSKVMMDNKPGAAECYGIVTMENAQAADAAVAAVNGMYILGRHIKVEVQTKDHVQPHQPSYPQPPIQQGVVQQGGVGPVRWQHRPAPATGSRWPY